MGGVGGSTTASVMRTKKGKGSNGVAVASKPENLMEITGWLDYQAGQSSHLTYQAKIQDTTHLFLSDYSPELAELRKNTNGLAFVVNGEKYEVLLIDDPMGMHDHLETYLRYTGVA